MIGEINCINKSNGDSDSQYTPTQAKLLDLCTLNLRFLFCLVNQKDDKGILNSMYAHKSSSLACIGALSSIL